MTGLPNGGPKGVAEQRKQNQKSAAHPFLFLCLQMLKSEPLAFCEKRTGLPKGGPKEMA